MLWLRHPGRLGWPREQGSHSVGMETDPRARPAEAQRSTQVGGRGEERTGKCCAGNLVELQDPQVMEERGKGLRRTNIQNKQNW